MLPYHLLPCQDNGFFKSFHRRFTEAVSSAATPFVIIKIHPFIKIKSKVRMINILLFAERNSIELFLHCTMQTFADSVALQPADLSFAMFDSSNLLVRLVLMVFRSYFELSATINQDAKQWHFLVLKEWQYSVVQDVSRSDGMLAFIKLGKNNEGKGINQRLLIGTAHVFDVPYIIGDLASQISWMFRFYFTERFTPFLFAFQSHWPGFCND